MQKARSHVIRGCATGKGVALGVIAGRVLHLQVQTVPGIRMRAGQGLVDLGLPVTMDDMIRHTQAVRRGAPTAFLIGDMPYMSYQASVEDAIRNAGRFMAETGCDAIKLEGGAVVADGVDALSARLAEHAVAGGAECMSRGQYWIPGLRAGQRMGNAEVIDAMVGALTDPFDDCHMGITAENVAAKWGISREESD